MVVTESSAKCNYSLLSAGPVRTFCWNTIQKNPYRIESGRNFRPYKNFLSAAINRLFAFQNNRKYLIIDFSALSDRLTSEAELNQNEKRSDLFHLYPCRRGLPYLLKYFSSAFHDKFSAAFPAC